MAPVSNEINLGDVAKDEITGFQGTVIAVTRWINNCDRLTLQPKIDKDGKVPESVSFDRPSLVLVKPAKQKIQPVRTGGPRPEPSRAAVRR